MTEAVGGGCRIRDADDERRALVDAWLPPARAPATADLEEALLGWGVVGQIVAAREDPSWQTATRTFHRPVEVGALRIRPPWEPPRGELIDVVIDPGMAFGSGQHATTRTCLTALCALPRSGLLDVGCGSGILAIAAAKLGFTPVRALDVDPDSVAAARRNAAANGVAITVEQVHAGAEALAGEPTLLANLTATALCTLAELPPEPVARRAVLSGMRDFEIDAVHGAWARLGLGPERVIAEDGWCTSVLVR